MSEYPIHPASPPFPVDKNRPVQLDGSHASMLMPERFDVETYSATRHNSTVTTCEEAPHVTLLSGREMFVPAGMCCVNHIVALGMVRVEAREVHCWAKSAVATAARGRSRVRSGICMMPATRLTMMRGLTKNGDAGTRAAGGMVN
jgi:hypothetical protein